MVKLGPMSVIVAQGQLQVQEVGNKTFQLYAYSKAISTFWSVKRHAVGFGGSGNGAGIGAYVVEGQRGRCDQTPGECVGWAGCVRTRTHRDVRPSCSPFLHPFIHSSSETTLRGPLCDRAALPQGLPNLY